MTQEAASQGEEKDDVSTTSHLDAKIHILNHGDAFGIYDQHGDIPGRTATAFGFFYKGCRFLSRAEMKLQGRRLIPLNARIQSQNEMLRVELMNDDFVDTEGRAVAKGVILISRAVFIFEGTCYESIQVQNFDQAAHGFELGFHFEADFKDIFEVRGSTRQKRGTLLGIEQPGPKEVRFAYQGLDKVRRETAIQFSEKLASCEGGACRVLIKLEPQAEYAFTLQVKPEQGGEKLPIRAFDVAQAKLLGELTDVRDLCVSLSSPNESLNRWMDRSIVDLISLLAEKGDGLYPYAGVPWYNTVFGRDGLITAYLTLWIAPEIARGVLKHLAHCQAQVSDPFADAEPGKILHEARDGEMPDLGEVPFKQYYGTVDATPLFVWLAGAYLQRTDDIGTLRELWPNLTAAMNWMKEHGDLDRDGFVEYSRKGDQGLHNQGWKDSHDAISHANGQLAELPIALSEVQGYVYAAKLSAAAIAKRLGHRELAETWTEEANSLKVKFNEVFWLDSLGTYALALDGKKQPCRVLSSNPGHCLLSGIVDEDKAETLAGTLLGDELSCRFGIRTLGHKEKRFNPLSYHNGSVWPHDNALIALGLSRYGQTSAANAIFQKLFDTSLYFEGSRLPELLCGLVKDNGEGPVRYPVACSPQAWSVATVFGLLQAVLGLEIDAPAKTLHIRNPQLPANVEAITIRNITTAEGSLSLVLQDYKTDVGIHVLEKPEGWKILTWK